MILQGKSIVDRIKERNLLGPNVAVGVKAVIGKDVSVQENAQDRFLTVTATTDDIDADGEIVIPSGADTSYFFANRKITVDHDLYTSSVVGCLHSATLKPNGWLCRLRIFKLAGNPLADDILTIAREDGIGVSIGFVPTDMGRPTPEEIAKYGKSGNAVENIIRKWKWIELSIAAFPCNVSCQSQKASKAIEGKYAVLDEMITKGRIHLSSAVALGLPVSKKIVSTAMPIAKPKRRFIVVG